MGGLRTLFRLGPSVADLVPDRLGADEDMALDGWPEWSVQAAERKRRDPGELDGVAPKHGRTTRGTEHALCMTGRIEHPQPFRALHETMRGRRHIGVGGEGRAMRLAAHRTMTVGDVLDRAGDRIADLPAQTAALVFGRHDLLLDDHAPLARSFAFTPAVACVRRTGRSSTDSRDTAA